MVQHEKNIQLGNYWMREYHPFALNVALCLFASQASCLYTCIQSGAAIT